MDLYVNMLDKLNSDDAMIESISEMPIGTGLLAFKGLNKVLSKEKKGINALDFGCGIGRSSRFLKRRGYNVHGVDISKKLLSQARKKNDGIEYIHLSDLTNKERPHQYNLILLSFVLMEIPSKDEITDILIKLKKFLTKNGEIIIITASNNFYTSNWLSIDTNYLQNKQALSGDVVKVYLRDYNLEINDYLWLEQDCESCFEKADLNVINKTALLGSNDDNKNWKDEYVKSPFIIYTLTPCCKE